MVQKRPDGVKICFDLCDLDLWPGPFVLFEHAIKETL